MLYKILHTHSIVLQHNQGPNIYQLPRNLTASGYSVKNITKQPDEMSAGSTLCHSQWPTTKTA